MIRSKLITNAFIPPNLITHTGIKVKPGEKAVAAVLKIERERGDWIYCCQAGGAVDITEGMPGDELVELDFDKNPLYLTPMGEATMKAAIELMQNRKHMILYFLECNVPDERLKHKVLTTIERVPAEWLLVVVGDIAGRCDGRIMKHLNLVGSVEADRPGNLNQR